MLNHELEEKGLFVEQVLVRYFKYSDEFQRNIEEKKLKDAEGEVNKIVARALSGTGTAEKQQPFLNV